MCKFLSRKLKCKIIWESGLISLERLVHPAGGNLVEFRQVKVEHHPLASQKEYERVELLNFLNCQF